MQFGVVEALERIGLDARLLPEPDPRLEVSVANAGKIILIYIVSFIYRY